MPVSVPAPAWCKDARGGGGKAVALDAFDDAGPSMCRLYIGSLKIHTVHLRGSLFQQ